MTESIELIQDPLEYAVRDIIDSSHLQNNELQFIPIKSIDKIAFDEDVKFPVITAISSVLGFEEDILRVELIVAIAFPEPELDNCNTEGEFYLKALRSARGFQIDLLEIAQWLTGKKKKPGDPIGIYDFNQEGEATIIVEYDPDTNEDSDDTNRKRIYRLVNVIMTIVFVGTHSELCCSRFDPADPGSSWDAVNQPKN